MSLKLGTIISGIEDVSERIINGEERVDGKSDTGTEGAEGGTNSATKRIEPIKEIGGIPIINAAELDGSSGVGPEPIFGSDSSGDSDERPKRGRPRGPNYKPRVETQKTLPNLEGLDGLILSAHLMCAKILSVPELELDEAESAKLAKSLKELAKHYAVIMDPKRIAWYEFATTAGGIYGPRVVAIWKNTERKKPDKIKQPVVTINEPGARPVTTEKRKVEVPSEVWPEGGAISDHEIS